MSVSGRQLRVDELDAGQRGAMLALLQAHFEGVDEDGFHHDLADKSHVILLEDAGRMVGFSTSHRYEHRGRRIIFSGDTIVDPAHWGSPVLARCWLAAIDDWRRQAPQREHYWFLICSGFRTYRFLPVFWRRFHPADGDTDDPELAPLLHELAGARFAERYCPGSGIIRLTRPQLLRADLRAVPDGRQEAPHVARFLALNPAHETGAELACLVRLHPDNQSRIGRRTWPLRT